METFEHSSRVLRANLAFREAEMLKFLSTQDEAIKNLNQSILSLTQSIAVAESSLKKLEMQYKQTLSEVVKWSRRIDLAMDNDREDLAREALIREQVSKERAISEKTQIKTQTSSLNNFQNRLSELKRKLTQLQEKRQAVWLELVTPVSPASILNELEELICVEPKYKADLEDFEMQKVRTLIQEIRTLLKGGMNMKCEPKLAQAQLPKYPSTTNSVNFNDIDSVDEKLETLQRQLDQL